MFDSDILYRRLFHGKQKAVCLPDCSSNALTRTGRTRIRRHDSERLSEARAGRGGRLRWTMKRYGHEQQLN